jgi:carbonic anhydrase
MTLSLSSRPFAGRIIQLPDARRLAGLRRGAARALLVAVASLGLAGNAQDEQAAPGTDQPQLSPINIAGAMAYFENLPPITFGYSANTAVIVTNTGSPNPSKSIKVDASADGANPNVIKVGGEAYTLKEFHFHAPSEHLSNGVPFKMEIHMVHQRVAGGVPKTVVVGRFINVLENDSKEPYCTNLNPILTANPAREQKFDFTSLEPTAGMISSFRYTGSLTTPNFANWLGWIVLAEPLAVSRAQYNAFTNLFANYTGQRYAGNSIALATNCVQDCMVSTDVRDFAKKPAPRNRVSLVSCDRPFNPGFVAGGAYEIGVEIAWRLGGSRRASLSVSAVGFDRNSRRIGSFGGTAIDVEPGSATNSLKFKVEAPRDRPPVVIKLGLDLRDQDGKSLVSPPDWAKAPGFPVLAPR